MQQREGDLELLPHPGREGAGVVVLAVGEVKVPKEVLRPSPPIPLRRWSFTCSHEYLPGEIVVQDDSRRHPQSPGP